MTTLNPNQIGVLIYWVGGFGPPSYMGTVFQYDDNGNVINSIPKPGSPKRVKIERWLDVAIAVCLAESGGDTRATNPHSTAAGLWQILVSAHGPEIAAGEAFVRANPSPTVPGDIHETGGTNANPNPTVFDPRVNTYAAASIYKNAGFAWTPWDVYNKGTYRQHLGHGKDVYAYLTSPANVRREIDRLNHIRATDYVEEGFHDPITQALGSDGWWGNLTGFLQKGALVVGVFVVGLILVIFALYSVISRTKAGRSVKSAVNLTPAGRVLKSVK